jgi:phosphoglycolate phosphatase-like HAD superfamily hydrolase
MHLLLFDIDGTLLQVTGGVHPAVAHAVSSITGRSVSTDGVTFSGRTDPAIFRDVLAVSGVADPDAVLDDVIATYAERAQETIGPDDVEPLPGVPELLSALAAREDVYLGLVTGNVESIAFHKLRRAGLSAHFSTGAFGSDHAERAHLPPMAVRRASTRSGHAFSPDRTIVIGDTRHDIACARAAGARAVAVCTGRYSREDLHPHAPDLLLDTLQDTETVLQKLMSPRSPRTANDSRHDL